MGRTELSSRDVALRLAAIVLSLTAARLAEDGFAAALNVSRSTRFAEERQFCGEHDRTSGIAS
ncbi:hypothetical protein GN958_ATG17095 [Phytophthora infestans]|uniref:Secreted RxLR effector peptide protein n=1 Tax=Phytophthora infestans TaxID=4787 RepID=A0A8S9U674_PHYIN|nr:hypothetical protein GN958_ATG17095 [Phytophthora infestans]